MRRRFLSFLMVVCIIIGLIPSQALAAMQQTNSTNPFSDVSINDWYYDAVQYVYENNIFNGTSATKFSPDGTMTRGMFVTVLGRMASVVKEEYAGQSAFTDVDASAYYAPYVAWAAKYGITNGTDNGKFSPDALINREQIATLFVRYFEIFGVEFDTGTNITSVPADIDQVSDFAKDAVLKLWKTGLLIGDGINFNPKGNATRAQAATLCKRTHEVVEVWYRELGVPADNEKDPSEPVKNDPKDEEKPEQSGSGTVYHTFKFDPNGGSSISDRSIRSGSLLNSLPTPYKANAIFVGWCYDEELTRMVGDTDRAWQSTILYAKYEEIPPLNEEFETPVARAIDTGKDFTVKISAPAEMTIDVFKEAVSLKNLSSNENRDWFMITGGNGSFTISGVNYLGDQGAQQPGFVEGAAYKITLEDSKLFFEGQDESTREYVFTIKREEIINVSLNANMKQIPLADISDLIVNGASASTISIPVITVGTDGAPAENGITTGSFTYSKGTLTVGDTIAICEGEQLPTMDAVNNDENTAFVEITAANGNRYSYKTASAENVLFTPDILPVSVNADTDGNANNHSITIPVSAMTYTDDHFALAGLDSQTTIDVGDYISFYSGTLQDNGMLSSDGTLQGYARITSVEKIAETYIITYETVSLAEVQKSMAAYKKESIESEDLLEGVDVQAIERNVEKQARESGFAEEAGMYLAALALETDSFTRLREDYGLTAVEMRMNGKPITQETLKSMGGNKAKVELSKLQATLNNKLVHFEGLKGLRLTLAVGVKVIIECNDDVTIEIEITGFFEQEVRIDIGVDGDAVWKWWGIFPYIAEYEVTAFVELYEYTGIAVEATIATIETDEDGFGTKNETIEKIGKQIKDLMDEKDKYIGDGKNTISDSLEEKYSDMLENETDWVTLFEKALIDRDFNVLLVIAINVEVKFVVLANLNISLGMDFWYENAKRYVYTIQVFDKKVKSDVIDLVEEHWEFEFYVMGTMGLRAGIRAGISVGLISTKLASVGFAAEAGAYVRVWGYFYYQLKYTASQGRSSSYSGAIYLEFGIYLDVTFEAQAIGGKFSYEKSLFEKEWPLLRAGDRDNVRDFAYKQKDVPSIKLKSYITSTRLPDSIFNMTYLDLKEGMDKDKDGNRVLFVANYDAPLEQGKTDVSKDKLDDEKNFTIEMTNTAFSYDPNTNTVSVSPNGEVKQEGEMIITWKNRPMEFSSVPIRRTMTLYWDNLKDGYIIAPFSNGGSYVPFIIKKYEEAVTAPEDPVKLGYIFSGWYCDENLTMPYTFPKTMPNVDTSIYAAWTPATDTPYTVEHYRQKLGTSEYELAERENFTGTTDSKVTPLTKSYTGFKTPASEELIIKADGSSVLRYYYDRQTYTVTFNPGEVGGDPVVIRLKYGSTISAPQFAAKGYIFRGWNEIVSTYMEDHDLTYTALWDKDLTTEYRIEYYVQQIDGRYVLQDVLYRTGTTGESINSGTLRMDNRYVDPGVISFDNVTVGGEQKDTVIISGDGKTVIKVNYKREQYTVTFKPENDGQNIVYTLYSGAAITVPKVSHIGYTFNSWEPEVPATVGTTDLIFTARWDGISGVTYRVNHIRQALDETYPDDGELVEVVELTGSTGNNTNATVMDYEGFTAQAFSQKKIAYDGSTVVEIHYRRNSYPVKWVVDGVTNTVQVKYGAIITRPDNPTNPGFVFDRWNGFAENTIMGTSERTFTAVWKSATDTPYTVKHIRADLNGNYPAEGNFVETEARYGITGTQTAAAPKYYPGFTANSVTQEIIEPDGTTEVTIKYDRNQYTVTWMVYNNNTYAITDENFGKPITIPEGTPEMNGYTFKQWLHIPDEMPANPVCIMAEFTPKTYEVYLDTNGGNLSVSESVYVTFNQVYGTLPIPTFDGYLFERWVDDNDNTITENTLVSIPADHTLKAVWVDNDAKPYTVRHLQQEIPDDRISLIMNRSFAAVNQLWQNASNDGYNQFDVENRLGTAGTEAAAKAKHYEGFTAKPFSQPTINEDGSTVVDIYYDRKTHTITWNINGTERFQSYRYGESIIPPEAERPGYTFTGWDMIPPDTMPDCELMYTAQWTANSYIVSFNGNSGSNTGAVTVIYDSRYPALAESIRTGYTFRGWYTDAQGGTRVEEGEPVAITENITLYAQWKPISCTVSFDLNGIKGEDPESITVTYDQPYGNLPEVTEVKTGYHFTGWHTASNGGELITGNTIVEITNDTTLFAQLAPNTYTVKFDANGAGGNMPDQLHTYDRYLMLAELRFTRNGYTFTGWNTKADGSGTPYKNRESVTNMTAHHGAVITLYAQWSINSYTITFNSAGGTPVEAITNVYNTNIEKPADPTRNGYTFIGWMNGDTFVTFPMKLTENLNLTAKWNIIEYPITYIGMTGIENRNPKSYTIESNAITLVDPGIKTGYTFMGWYTDEALSDAGRVKGIAISAGSTGARTFYASWQANLYGVNFDDGTESNNAGGSMSAQTFVYDVLQPLKTNEFTNPGYTFEGWGITPNSDVLYTDGQVVKNLVPSGSITLYAQWKAIPYTISYTLGSGASGVNNPTSYTIEAADITLKAPSDIKAGYQFLGWFNGDTKVTSIPKGSTGNVSLTAKWAHGGTFTLAQTGEKANGSAKDITFTVTRTFPSDAVATTDPQRVYFRTVNGTAIGGTAAPIHFSHVGGEDIFLTFNQSDTQKTFVVQKENYFTGDGDIVNSFTTGVSRYYDVELYRIVSPIGNCTGVLGNTHSARRTLTPGADYILDKSFCTTEYYSTTDSTERKITDDGFDRNSTRRLTISPDLITNMKATYKQYAKSTVSNYGLRMSMDVREEDDGYQYIRMSFSGSRTYSLKFEIKAGSKYTSWSSLVLPMTGDQGVIKRTEYTYNQMQTKSVGGATYLVTNANEVLTMQFDASGNGNDDWLYKNHKSYLRILDTTEPTVKRIAPMAYGQYKTGDTIIIAVEFNELIASVSNVTMSKFSTIPINGWTYVDGVGTNVLVFRGTLSSNFEVTPDMNMTLTATKPTVSGTIKDLAD